MEQEAFKFAIEYGVAGFALVALGYYIFWSTKEHGKERIMWSEERDRWRKDLKENFDKIVSVVKSHQEISSQVSDSVSDIKNTIKSFHEKR